MSNLPVAWLTPKFQSDDPIITRSMSLRPSLWAVVFAVIEDASHDWNWFQADMTHATVEQVVGELIEARTILEREPNMYIGEVREFATNDLPDGWLRCNGATYLNTDYPLLAAVINIGLVVDATHFRVPDRDRRIGIDGFTVGMQGGAETHTLAIGEIPAHTHSYDKTVVAASTVLGELPGIELGDYASTATGSAGGGGAHNNMPPYEGSVFAIRAFWPTAGG